MAFITADRVRDTSTTAGSGAFSVSGTAPTGYRTFSAVLSVSDTFYYSIQHQTLDEWEVGLGTYSSANTFARTTIYSSSNAGSAVTFSAGTKDVFITMAAARSPQLNASGNITALGTVVSATLTNATGLPLTTGVTGVLPFANGGMLALQSVQTASFTAVSGNAYPVNTTSGAITVTLPASPAAGNIVQITDYAGTWATNKITVNPNSGKINGSTSNALVGTSRETVAFIYVDSTQGWLAYSGFNTSTPSQTYTASYLIAAGGGGGGKDWAGGGGAGGLLTGTSTLTPGTNYTITVGAGGAGQTSSASSPGTSGSNSSFSAVGTTALGGGGGGSGSNGGNIGTGGSGGGAGSSTSGITGAAGTAGQGNKGGNTTVTSGGPAGGGGAGAVGGNGVSGAGGAGGAGSASSITGSSVTYSGGGGGAGYSPSGVTAGAGGAGGGGAGNATSGGVGTAGTANTGGGGGGGAGGGGNGGAGGSGVVILSVPTASYSGTTTGSPTVTTSGSDTIIKFTTSGSYTA